MLQALLFIIGAQIGSFLNVCIWRLPRKESIVHPPSHCPSCNTRLRGLDLFPLLSQLYLRGRCRYCGAKFSWRYFGIELLTGVLFALAAMQPGVVGGYAGSIFTGDPIRLLRDCVFIACLVVVFWVDYDTRLIQLESVFILALAGIGFEFWQVANGQAQFAEGVLIGGQTLFAFPAPLPGSIVALVVTASGLWLLREFFSFLYRREAMGFGDVMLVAAIAANLGWNATIITFVFLSVVVGAAIAVLMQIPHAVKAWRWAKKRQQKYSSASVSPGAMVRRSFRRGIPFGPMLAGGAIAALLYGVQLNDAYIKMWTPAATQSNVTMQYQSLR